MRKLMPVIMTGVIFTLLVAGCLWRYGPDFLSLYSTTSLLTGVAPLGVIAVGMTLVILTGGIDLSVGAVLGLTTVVMATLMMKHDWSPAAAIAAGLGVGTAFGLVMGLLIRWFELAPFLVTLGGLFFARGLVFLISVEAIGIDTDAFNKLLEQGVEITIGEQAGFLGIPTMAFLAVVLVGSLVGTYTRFGRNVYAIGGNESSAALMGLPVGRTKVLVYMLSGFCASLAGVLLTLNKPSGDPQAGLGMELEAIAAVVVGGTLLSGGVGYIQGTLLGVLIFGIIQGALPYENLLSWWANIATGTLLFVFILLQRLLTGTNALRRRRA